MTLVLVLTILPVDQAQAQALGNSAEQAQDHKQIKKAPIPMVNDPAIQEKVEKLETLHQDYAKALEKKDLQAIPTLDNRFLDILGPAPEDSLKEPAPDKAKAPREKPQPDAKVADKLDVVGDAKALEQDKMSLDTIRSTYSALAGKTEGDVLKQKMNLVESALKLCRAQAAGHAVGGAEGHPKP
ncbi:hypothetical protein CSB20_00440 [bacterium DOLZORAL124_64_63]|nr:MAG: hypothetical protein CSB20_00440 [bacterium DOLZORAL124_64_63]